MPHTKNSNVVVAVDFIDNDVGRYGNQLAGSLNPARSTAAGKNGQAFTGKQKLAGDASRGDLLRDNQDESPRDNQDERDLRGLR